MSQSRSGTFQHTPGDEPDGCSCPIHAGQSREPFTAPLGLPFAADVSTSPIRKQKAESIYRAHHSYMDAAPGLNKVHYGVHYQDSLVGAITSRYSFGNH
jgi:hypothetical protein